MINKQEIVCQIYKNILKRQMNFFFLHTHIMIVVSYCNRVMWIVVYLQYNAFYLVVKLSTTKRYYSENANTLLVFNTFLIKRFEMGVCTMVYFISLPVREITICLRWYT